MLKIVDWLYVIASALTLLEMSILGGGGGGGWVFDYFFYLAFLQIHGCSNRCVM